MSSGDGQSYPHPPGITRGLTLAFAVACGVTVGNLYYAQPLIGPISASLGFDLAAAGLIVTLFQLGYVAGLILLVPLGDLVENRALVVRTLIASMLALALAAVSPSPGLFLLAAVLIGFTSCSVQMLIPIAAHLAPEERRGRVVGTVMSGLLMGILLSRPIATLVGGAFGWRAMFALSSAAMVAVAWAMARRVPRRVPEGGFHYGQLLLSLWTVLRDTPVLQRRAAYQALMFGAFSLFWTAVPLALAAPPFSYGTIEIAAFMLSGVGGAFAAPFAGRLADHGWTKPATAGAFAVVAVSFVLAWIGGYGVIAVLVAAGILLDAGVHTNVVLGQRAIYMLHAGVRSRLNALYLAIFFCGGAVGSALAGFSYVYGGWPLVCAIGLIFPLLGGALFLTEKRAV
ncbi:MAG: MFS transporter [Alphaproteobacteria bacterium]|nr:MFS transporter [Alphaproteobacteria bacterium]